jgi:hypothetical protein
MNKRNCNCPEEMPNCGEFKGNESKEEKLKHLKDCKKSFQKRIKEIDIAITKLEN